MIDFFALGYLLGYILSCQNPFKNVLFGLLHIALGSSLHATLNTILPVPFFQYLSTVTFDFLCGWLAEGDSWREAAVPQWSTTLPLSVHAPCLPPLLLLDWTQIKGSAGYGQSKERVWRDWSPLQPQEEQCRGQEANSLSASDLQRCLSAFQRWGNMERHWQDNSAWTVL